MALKASVQSAGIHRSQVRPFCAASRPSAKVHSVVQETQTVAGPAVSRRQILDAAAISAVYLATPQIAQAAKAPAGFVAVEDLSDNYRFLYPFGWQEVSIAGADIVFKDVVEPLESVSVTMVRTDKSDISEYGSVEEVSETLAKSVLTAPGTDVKVLSTSQREDDKGHKYFELEFTAAASNFTRHQLAVVAVANGRFYTLTTGSSERRWGKMKDKLNGTAKSFSLLF